MADVKLKPLAGCGLQAVLTNRLQTADILEWVLTQTGPARICMTSFSISEEFLRRLFFILKGYPGSSISLLLDHKATKKTLSLWAFIAQVFDDTRLCDNHSKVITVDPVDPHRPKVAVVTSQNLTRGNRHESTVITTDLSVFNDLNQSIANVRKYHSVPIAQLLGERIGAD